MRLYEITSNYRTILDVIGEEGEQDYLVEQRDFIQGELVNKSKGLMAVFSQMDSDIKAVAEEKKRLADLEKSLKKSKDRFKDYVKLNMESMKMEKVKSPFGTLYLTENSVEITDMANIDDKFKSVKLELKIPMNDSEINKKVDELENFITGVKVVVDKNYLKQALKNGEECLGARVINTLGVRK